MEPSTEPDASASGLRSAGFIVTVLGALLAGVGAALTWVTVGIETVDALDTVTKGLDVWDGIVVLVCAVAMLVGVLASRLVSSGSARRGFGALVIAAGFVALSVAGAFVMTATTRFDPVDDDRLVAAIAEAAGVPPSEVQASIDETLGELGAFTRIGPGPYLAIAGGLAGAIGGVLVLAWASRVPDPPDP
jgi:apolipoprotein N-acyltransferase